MKKYSVPTMSLFTSIAIVASGSKGLVLIMSTGSVKQPKATLQLDLSTHVSDLTSTCGYVGV